MDRMNRRQLLAGLGALAAPGLLRANASEFPNKPIRIIVPATAGGGADIGARRVGEMLREAWGQSVVVENRPGAAGSIAAAFVARAEKTGHVVGMATDSSVLINPLVMPDVNYKLEDFQLLSPLYMGGMALAVNKDFPAANIREFVEVVRRRADVSCAMFGVVSSPRLVAEMFMADAGIRFEPVAYKGEAEAVRDLLGGVVPAFFGTTASLLPQHQAGTLRILGVSFTERIKALPDTPTFKEAGLANTVYRWFHGLMLPAGTPRDIVDKFASTLVSIVGSDKFRAGIAPDLTPTPMQPAAFAEMVYASRERVADIIRRQNLKA